jgi:hypothetical protein
VVYHPSANLFVAINSYNFNNSTQSNTAAWSTDGITWTQSTLPKADTWGSTNHGATFAVDKIVVVGWYYNYVTYTTDGKTWSNGTAIAPTTSYLDCGSIGYANGVFVVPVDISANASKTIYTNTSVTAGAWTARTLAYYPGTVSVANNKFFIYGYAAAADASPTKLLTSTDGATWTTQSVPAAAAGTTVVNYRRVAYGNGVYVTIGSFQGLGGSRVPVAYSSDGVTWTPSSFGLPNAYWDEIVFTGKYFLVTNRGEGTSAGVYYSYDGNFWYPIYNTQPGNGAYLYDIAYGNGKFVAVTPWYGSGIPTNIPVVGTA